jgi:hypothetical protein
MKHQVCFRSSGLARDKLKLSLIRSDNSEYFNYLEQLSQKLSAGFKKLRDPISEQKYTKLTIDLYSSYNRKNWIFKNSYHFSISGSKSDLSHFYKSWNKTFSEVIF